MRNEFKGTDWQEYIDETLQQLEDQVVLRRRGGLSLALPLSPGVVLDFGSNDYLGLRSHPAVLRAAMNAVVTENCWGASSSPVLRGYGPFHSRLERAIADFEHTEDSLVFSSGYACNVGVISALVGPQDAIFSDELNHASLIDGCRLSRATKFVYQHGSLVDLENLLSQHRWSFERAIILTESVFSMDGDCAPMQQILQLATEWGCGVVVDEAHATGVLGADGAGLCDSPSDHPSLLCKLGTLSKALGGIGGFVAGGSKLIEFLVNQCRSYMFSTAIPVPVAAAATQAVYEARKMSAERSWLHNHSSQLRCWLNEQGWRVPSGTSPIIPIVIGDGKKTLEISQSLLEQGVYVPAIRPPTVPEGTSRLRVSLTVNHTSDCFERLKSALSKMKSK
ncbi:MAG: 8-amino-7-oxononanoate synthase [Planctomycetales bacterium]|nr:8-amino-7-oxononanoate synthase [Planctomycetales bacterium]